VTDDRPRNGEMCTYKQNRLRPSDSAFYYKTNVLYCSRERQCDEFIHVYSRASGCFISVAFYAGLV